MEMYKPDNDPLLRRLRSDVRAPVPEEVASLMNDISDVCAHKRINHIVCALWLTLLRVIVHAQKCTPEQAIKHACATLGLAKTKAPDTRDEASIRIYTENTLFHNAVNVHIKGNYHKGFAIPGPKGQMLLKRVEQICLEAIEETKEAAE
jgi:hypothetical protein